MVDDIDELRKRQRELLGVELPIGDFPWGRFRENPIGLCQIPVGVAGPLRIANEAPFWIPLATTEHALVASVNRGCKLLRMAEHLDALVYGEGISRGPVIETRSVRDALELREWIHSNSSLFGSCHVHLQSIHAVPLGRYLFVRFRATCQDAMGMNMITRATDAFLKRLKEAFPERITWTCLSGNFCTDKKDAAVNWVLGRGCSVTAEASIPKQAIRDILHCSAEELFHVFRQKCLVGSAMAGGSAGSQNAHAANTVAAVFAACGQDLAHIGASSACLCNMQIEGESLYFCLTMPVMEVGTVGGGTDLPTQRECLKLILVEKHSPADLAKRIALAVMAGELSLLGSLAEGSLVQAHEKRA